MSGAELLIVALAVIWLIEFYLFGMQRASLLISRTSEVDWKSVGVHLLPVWYPVTWAVRLAKWVLLVALFFVASWQVGLGCFVIGFVLSSVIPIPYRLLYSRTFQRSAARIEKQDPEAGELFRSMLQSSGFVA